MIGISANEPKRHFDVHLGDKLIGAVEVTTEFGKNQFRIRSHDEEREFETCKNDFGSVEKYVSFNLAVRALVEYMGFGTLKYDVDYPFTAVEFGEKTLRRENAIEDL